ncbi:MAG: hypothetical protein A4E42_00255 [Methanoregulaceae archaeon PtaU1.Bin222]|nr:MAG: hypothetical protein A4E42_00255 [Methanoregulaceae archaeon PtaU1.Bin222]
MREEACLEIAFDTHAPCFSNESPEKSTEISMCFATGTDTMEYFRVPQRNRATSSGFPTVAESPIRWNSPAYSASRSSATAI